MKSSSFFAFLLLGLLLAPAAAAQPQIDGEPKARRGTFAVTNVRIETVSSGVIESGTIVIENDLIVAIGANVTIPPGAEIIDGAGQTAYPGMIDSGTRLGLVEVGSDPRTIDFREVGDVTPHVEALTAINPNSVAIPVTRVSGVTTVISAPTGGLFPGKAALVNLHGYTPEQMSVGGVQLMTLTFPTSARRGRFDQRSEEDVKKAYDEAIQKLDGIWEDAKLYARIDSAYRANPDAGRRPEYNPEMTAMLPVVRGQMPLLVTVEAAKDITAAIAWVKKQRVARPVFSGVAEGWRVADELAEAGIPCIVGPMLSTPTRDADRYDKAYANIGLLHKAGVKVAIQTGDAENVRNLPFNAGFAATYGMGREEALRAVTLAPAEIFGVADQLGSLEVGKKANLFIANGDPFETKTKITKVFIDGYDIPLENRQTRLYEEFLERTPGLEKHPKAPEVAAPTG
ncbi:MAG: amidohydrolase family protein [Rhodothermales bacterium]